MAHGQALTMNEPPDLETMSTVLSHGLDTLIGTEEEVSIRRTLILIKDHLLGGDSSNSEYVSTGSFGDGFSYKGADTDMMCVSRKVKVICNGTHTALPSDYNDTTTILVMRDAESRPGYVTLELAHLGREPPEALRSAMVPTGNAIMISSDIYRQYTVDTCSSREEVTMVSNGPCNSFKNDEISVNFDIAESFPCDAWPTVADEWAHRPKIHGWPDDALVDNILRRGCHILPVGDKTSPDTFLQWRISFVTSERLLVHSLGHLQFKVYGLLKYFLKYIQVPLRTIIADDDILCSYFMKTLIFHACETTPQSLWQDKNTAVCFHICLKLLVDWLESGHCPHYFIKSNNLFQRKVHGENRRKVLNIVTHFIDKTNLSFIREICSQAPGPSASTCWRLECRRDHVLFNNCANHIDHICGGHNMRRIHKSSKLMMAAQSETDVFATYYAAVNVLSSTGRGIYTTHAIFQENKSRYAILRMCKTFLSFFDMISSAPLNLATFFFLVGNFRKAVKICEDTISSQKNTVWIDSAEGQEKYQRLFCGKGYSIFKKFKAIRSMILFRRDTMDFALPHIRLEVKHNPFCVIIPQLSYAAFLSFICYHELGITSRRHDALRQLIILKYDDENGGDRHWIVHTLVGVCYEILGDRRRAIRNYLDSYNVQQAFNPALERIKSLRRSF